MRMVRGVKALVEYLESINCKMSHTTIFELLRQDKIPHSRPSARVLLFDLNAIDEWLGGNQ